MRVVTYSWMAVVLAVACAAIGWLGLAGWMAVVVLVASVGMHVAGNALGTRMRESADRELSRGHATAAHPLFAEETLPVPTPTRLERRETLGSLVPVSATIGAVSGGIAGSLALMFLTASSPAGAILGGASSAVIGGLFGFLVASFVEILRGSLRDAIAAERPPRHVIPSQRS